MNGFLVIYSLFCLDVSPNMLTFAGDVGQPDWSVLTASGKGLVVVCWVNKPQTPS